MITRASYNLEVRIVEIRNFSEFIWPNRKPGCLEYCNWCCYWHKRVFVRMSKGEKANEKLKTVDFQVMIHISLMSFQRQ